MGGKVQDARRGKEQIDNYRVIAVNGIIKFIARTPNDFWNRV